MSGEWIRERRKHLKLSQTELGDRIGVSQNQISLWETNKHAPQPAHLRRLTEVLGPLEGLPSSEIASASAHRSPTEHELAAIEERATPLPQRGSALLAVKSSSKAVPNPTRPLLAIAETLIATVRECSTVHALDELITVFRHGETQAGRLFRSLPRSNADAVRAAWQERHSVLLAAFKQTKAPALPKVEPTAPRNLRVVPEATPIEPARQRFARVLAASRDHYQIVRVVKETPTSVTVEEFFSPVGPQIGERSLLRGDVEFLADGLPEQSLVYRREGNAWRLGRSDSREIEPAALIGHGVRSKEPHYLVRFPNGPPKLVPRSELFVRCQRETDDPTELLAAQITESPFFSEARRVLAKFVAGQRAAFRGVTALAGAAIDLHPHQLATVSRVLSDPVQRYLLADEVGLGKTIEAGLLIRQYLLDDGPHARVLALVPEHLVTQWREELRDKFFITNDDRVRVASFDLLDDEPVETPGLLVVDEAHHSSAWASSTPERYQRLAKLASAASRVLLLSGTPVLHHEDGFLAMLHLLDPDTYSLTDLAGFQRLIEGRRKVADALGNLFEDGPNAFVRSAVELMLAGFPDDGRLRACGEDVLASLSPPVDALRRDQAIRELRTYVVERYRLDRRLLRTHRDHPSVGGLLPKRAGLIEIACPEDQWRASAGEWVSDWRASVSPEHVEGAATAALTFSRFVEAAITHPALLIRAFDDRREGLRRGEPPAFDNEDSWLTDASAALARAPHRDRRESQLAAFFNQQRPPRRAVVFVDDPRVADEVAGALSRYLGRPARLLRMADGANQPLDRFWAMPDAILLCDRNGEDGLNLQRKPVSVVFYDFPLDPGRLEQRLGRVDRLEGIAQVSIHGVSPANEYERAWVTLVSGVVRLFERTVAPLQYVLSQSIRDLRVRLLAEGCAAFVSLGDAFADPEAGLDAQFLKLRRQELLDAPEWDENEERAFIAEVERAREDAEANARDAISGWLAAIQLDAWPRGPATRVRHFYQREERRTLIPLQELLPDLQQYVDRTSSTKSRLGFGPFVFRESDREAGDHLLQFGDRFFDVAVAQMERDDRGKSWGIWRLTTLSGFEEPAVFVQFEFLIDLDVSELQQQWEQRGTGASLRRRADAVLSPQHRVVWFSSAGERVVDMEVQKELTKPYKALKEHGCDLNLRPDRWAIADSRTNVVNWEGTVLELRRRAEQSIRDEPDFRETCRRAVATCRTGGARTVATLEARAHLGTASERVAAERVIAAERQLTNALAAGSQHPRFRVRSAGAVILCNTPLGEEA